jgi:hypothetical protein
MSPEQIMTRDTVKVIEKAQRGDRCASARDVCDRMASYRVDGVPLCVHHASRYLTNADLLSLFSGLDERMRSTNDHHKD